MCFTEVGPCIQFLKGGKNIHGMFKCPEETNLFGVEAISWRIFGQNWWLPGKEDMTSLSYENKGLIFIVSRKLLKILEQDGDSITDGNLER